MEGTSLSMELIMSGVKPYLYLTLRRYSWETGLQSRSLNLSCRTMLNIGSLYYFCVVSSLVPKMYMRRFNLQAVLIICLGLNDHILIQLEKASTKLFYNSTVFVSKCRF